MHGIMALTHLLSCPVCGSPLSQSGNTLACIHAHTFDIAREGYVNLLRKKLPGDTKEMLLARRQFLEQGYYQPLSTLLNEQVYAHLVERQKKACFAVLDAGCGEGYYLGHLQRYLTDKLPGAQAACIGVDISKEGIRLAARRYQACSFVVANLNERLTFADASLDVLLNIFAPRNAEEFARVLAPGGLLIVVIPGPTHLLQLRQQLHLLNIEEQKQQRVQEQFSDLFALQITLPLHYSLQLHGPEIAQAVMMTPNYWHLSSEMRQSIAHTPTIQTDVDMLCLLWRRKTG